MITIYSPLERVNYPVESRLLHHHRASPMMLITCAMLVPHVAERPIDAHAFGALPLKLSGARATLSMCDAAEEEEDWVAARIAAEDRSFHAKREASRLARIEGWEEEMRAMRAAASAPGGGGEAAADEEPANTAWAQYELQLSKATIPKTEEEKREAYHKDLLAQIDQADAMDERLRQKNEAARLARLRGFED